MRITDLLLTNQQTHWEISRDNRVKLEAPFRNFTGHIDVAELHIPYTRWDYIDEMVKEAKKYKGKKIFVSGGDSLNFDMFSVFYNKSGDDSKPSDEIKTLIKFLTIIHRVYDHIIFIESNHEARVHKILARICNDKTVAQELRKQIRSLSDQFFEAGLNKVVYVPTYIFQLGDTLFTHMEANSASAGAVSRSLVQYLSPRIQKPWNVCFQLHTHTQSKISIDRKTIVETGAIIPPLDYWRQGKPSGKGKMSSIGYGVCDMKDGKVDVNSANYIIKEWEDYL